MSKQAYLIDDKEITIHKDRAEVTDNKGTTILMFNDLSSCCCYFGVSKDSSDRDIHFNNYKEDDYLLYFSEDKQNLMLQIYNEIIEAINKDEPITEIGKQYLEIRND